MSRAIFGRSLADAGTIVAGAELPAFPASNLLTRQAHRRWRTADPGAAWITLDLGSPVEVDLVWLGATNLSGAADWRIRAATAAEDLVPDPVWDSGAVQFWPEPSLDHWAARSRAAGFVWLGDDGPGPVTARHWRIDLLDGGNPAGFLEAGRLVLARAWRPAKNVQYPVDFVPLPARPGVQRGRSGARWAEDGAVLRRFDLVYDHLGAADALSGFAAMVRRLGAAGDLVWIFDPGPGFGVGPAPAPVTERMIQGGLDLVDPVSNNRFNRHRLRLAIGEY